MPFTHNGEGIEMGKNFTPVPEGEYKLAIEDTTMKVTKNGDPMVSAKCVIVENGQYDGKKVWYNIVFMKPKDEEGKPKKGAGLALHFLSTIGEPYSTEGEYDVNEQQWIGKTFLAKLKIEKGFDGKDRNAVAYVIKPEPVEGQQDEIPF